jgi:hypothetical protein
MNRITVCQPTRLAVSDSCPFGIGGFLLVEGRVWHVQIPASRPVCGQLTANNFLEFLDMVVSVWLMCSTFTDQSESLLAIGDDILKLFVCMPTALSQYKKALSKKD